ncbi:MAG: hypothetical protein JO183_09960, partial [Ktedonobacteraceae bacterium]|nr:hypothetical protein [Ktedonobacteraceae bacterium]
FQIVNGCAVHDWGQNWATFRFWLGAARFNPIEISSQGDILNWPDGFFEETMLQEDRITAAGLKKRAKKTANG